ncbi:outer membrane beta-barrel protein [Kaarinaea lacus]
MLLLFVSLSAYGKDEVTRHVIELNLGVGYYTFDSKRELTDMEMAGMGFGVHFFRRWAVLLNYSALNSERTGIQAGEKVDVQKFHVDVYRYFNTEHKFRPYIVAGLGRMDIISEGDKRDETQWNGGLGLSYRITPKWFLRGDGRVLYNGSGNHTDYAYMLTLAFRLKEGERGD